MSLSGYPAKSGSTREKCRKALELKGVAADLGYTWEEGILQLRPAVVGKGGVMKETRLIMPELGLIAGTRAALGGGVALLLADKLTNNDCSGNSGVCQAPLTLGSEVPAWVYLLTYSNEERKCQYHGSIRSCIPILCGSPSPRECLVLITRRVTPPYPCICPFPVPSLLYQPRLLR